VYKKKAGPIGSKRFADISYFPPAAHTEIVGKVTARLIEFLVRDAKVSPSNIHLIGHSLGAHSMGWAGAFLNLPGQQKVSRITGK